MWKFGRKKGNLIVVLIGLISVMLIMVMAMSKRMTSHSQLLTLGDYTQISRYFLESYVGDVMQQMRYASNDPNSEFSKQICESIDSGAGDKKLKLGFYKRSAMLDDLRNDLAEMQCDYKPVVEIINTEPMEYPTGIEPGSVNNGKEKKGLLQITCKCKFRKRDYKLVVQYPFSVVFRVTPIIKDFMLFVDNIHKEQTSRDKINVLKIANNRISDYQDLRTDGSYKIKPMILLQPLDQKYDSAEKSGKVYLGRSDKGVYLNLSGGASDAKINETFLISARDLGMDSDLGLTDISLLEKKNGDDVALPGWSIPLKHGYALMGVMGFCQEFSEIFDGAAWTAEDFFKSDDSSNYWSKSIKDFNGDAKRAMSYASALKLFGLNQGDGSITNREIYGNVFARFLVLTFWNPVSAMGRPLVYDLNKSVSDVPIATSYDYTERRFEPVDGYNYQYFMSKIMSGLDYETNKSKADPMGKVKYFMDMNIDTGLKAHRRFSEEDFTAADGFRLGSNFKLHDFGKVWYDVARKESQNRAAIEDRIGRAFKDQEEFKEAVGYKDGKFKVNGVVYVKGNLELDDMNLSNDDCSGGIVLVDGSIKLGNITRGEKIKSSDFVWDGHKAEDLFKKWNNPDKSNKYYIGQDKILTFVSLRGNKITLNGNILLGVQLVNLADPNGSSDQDQITWSVRDGIVFYGSIVTNRLNLTKRVQEFADGKSKDTDKMNEAPFFVYPPVMADEKTSLAVQITESMRGYTLTSGKVIE